MEGKSEKVNNKTLLKKKLKEMAMLSYFLQKHLSMVK